MKTSKYPTGKAGRALAKHLGVGGKGLVQNLNPLEVLREYVSYRKTALEQQTERERIAAKRDVAVRLIDSERDLILAYFEQRCAERKETLDSLFDILHTALQEKNDPAMDAALSGILGVVKDSPLNPYIKKIVQL